MTGGPLLLPDPADELQVSRVHDNQATEERLEGATGATYSSPTRAALVADILALNQ